MENRNYESENAALKTPISELDALVKYYEDQFLPSKHHQYGVSSQKSEYDFAQISIFNEVELTADDNVLEPELAAIKKHYRKSRHHYV